MNAPARGGGERGRVELQRKLDGALDLPSLPSIVRRLGEVCRDSSSGTRQVADLIAQDPPLCARTLRVVNSAHIGLRMRVVSIEHAAAVLGMDALQNLVVQASLGDLFESLSGRSGLDLRVLWQHAILTGRIAHRLSPRARAGIDEDELELAGLLHDIGKFVLLDIERETYLELMARAGGEGVPLCRLEREAFGYDHTQVGSVLADRWGLPESVERCIAFHHSLDDSNRLRLPGVAPLILADRLAHAVQRHPADPPEDLLSFLPPRVAVHLRLQPGEVRELAAYAAGLVNRITF